VIFALWQDCANSEEGPASQMSDFTNQSTVHAFPGQDESVSVGGVGLEILNKLGVQDWVAFFKCGSRQEFQDGETILRAGMQNDAVFFVADGEVRVLRHDGDEPVMLARLAAGSLFGEMSFLDKTIVSADIVAEGRVEVFRVEGRDLQDLIDTNAEFGKRFYHSLAVTLSRRLRSTNKRVDQPAE